MKNFKPQYRMLRLLALIFMAAIVLPGCDTEGSEAPSPIDASLTAAMSMQAEQNKLIAGIRHATAKYHQVEAAIADGYILPPGSECVPAPDGIGAMGYHYVNMDLIDPVVEPFKPEVLLYELKPDGQWALTGVEYIKVKLSDDETPPLLGNKSFDEQAAPIPDPNFTLHVWIWKNNPAGMYAPFNPKVSCN